MTTNKNTQPSEQLLEAVETAAEILERLPGSHLPQLGLSDLHVRRTVLPDGVIQYVAWGIVDDLIFVKKQDGSREVKKYVKGDWEDGIYKLLSLSKTDREREALEYWGFESGYGRPTHSPVSADVNKPLLKKRPSKQFNVGTKIDKKDFPSVPRKDTSPWLRLFVWVALAGVVGLVVLYGVLGGGDNKNGELQPAITVTPVRNSDCVGGVCTYYGKQPPYSRSTFGTRIQLVNNPNATDPTWQELKTFITADKTDESPYWENIFMCGSYAEEVHNNAEAAGIKAAWVGVDFQGQDEGHAMNAFKTSDRGLVFIDCTGGGVMVERPITCSKDPSTGLISCAVAPPNRSYDKVAYVSIGRDYGLVSLDEVRGLSYQDYEEYVQDWNDYDLAVEKYNNDIETYNADFDAYDSLYTQCGGYATVGKCRALGGMHDDLERQETQLDSRSTQLEAQGATLGGFWEILGVVSKIEIYW
jgi:hypothetical protein